MYIKVLLFSLLSFSSYSAEQLKFAVYDPGFPPYLFINEAQQIKGIIPDLLQSFADEQSIALDYVIDNRQGGEQRLYEGLVDVMVLSPPWTRHPEQLLFTDEILPYTDYLFKLDKSNKNTQWQPGNRVCTREYYVYPTLKEQFASNQLLRLDASSEETQLRMLENGRCDFAYLNELIGYWLLQERFPHLFLTTIEQNKAVDSLKLALIPTKASVLPSLNAHIAAQKQNGNLRSIVRKYVRTLPKQ
ncbi:transporter substrate-binding domain-containing protein [Bowmanella sp. Y26]|uniref:substrate-binding periplasmic protein n=1 Tax=Bowmanella yangjiangensis TaxID=2811230 RepID=UPI001BDDB950|nr:transporter substrate-binding domain-containing protein [Bowmanella yangjiangensis]MBT1062172.1 transporter substrate-binding domain-containing protein [Bowmanella yangjiangensis]